MAKPAFPKVALAATALLLAAAACAPSAEDPGVKTHLVAVDTSESAGIMHDAFGGRVRDELAGLPLEVELRLFRFDSSPAEVASGPPPDRDSEAAKLLKQVMAHRSATKGTNMAKLVALLDRHLAEVATPAKITIYTDCGVELVTPQERKAVQETTRQWSTDPRVASVRIVGLRDGYREEIRDLFQLSPDKFQLEGRSSTDPGDDPAR